MNSLYPIAKRNERQMYKNLFAVVVFALSLPAFYTFATGFYAEALKAAVKYPDAPVVSYIMYFMAADATVAFCLALYISGRGTMFRIRKLSHAQNLS